MDIESFARFFAPLTDAMLLVSAQGQVLAWNPAAQSLFSRVGLNLSGASIGQLVVDPQEKVQRYLSQCARSRELLPGALRFRTPNGEGFACRTDGAVVRPRTDAGAALILLQCRAHSTTTSQFVALNERIAALSREISERRRAEEELDTQREWLRVTLSSIGDAVIATDINGAVSFINTVAEKMTGWIRQEAIGQPLQKVFFIIKEETRQPTESPVSRVLRDGIVVGLANHTILISRDGTERPIEDSAAPIRDGGGVVTGVVLVFRDATSQREAERVNKELLLREQVVRAEAEKSNRIKDEFLAILSHELRTPLSAIIGWVQLLQQKKLSPERVDYGLEVIARNVRAQTQLISDLLDSSRILSGKMGVEHKPVDLTSVIAMAIDSIRPAATAKGIDLRAELDDAAGLVQGDPNRLQQVLWNLLQNSIKFTPTGGWIEVRLERDGASLKISVKDSGIGIEPEFLPHLFERFRQADSTVTRRHGGLGLGLSLVRELIELHGGSVSADSLGPGQGTTVTLRIPRRTAPLLTGERATVGTRASDQSMISIDRLAGLRILLVEDDPDSREIIRLTLHTYGAEIIETGSAAEALEQLHQRMPDVLISDIGLPEEDGFSLIRRIRKLSPAQGGFVPALALTAFARPADSERALQDGFHQHLAKPATAAALVEAVARLTGRW